MSLLKGVDSFSAPTTQQLALAKAAGVAAWNGYLPGKGIDSTWTSADFARIKDAGLYSIAYASGWADPLVMRGLANQWGVRGCLDVESGIRGDGSWVQPWLDASGFGVYHEEYAYPGYTAPFHVMADYVASDPSASWPASLQRPAGPVGWQWKSNVVAYDAHVDLCYFDSGIWAAPDPPPPPPLEDDMTVIEVNPGDAPHLIPGFETTNSVNLVALKDCSVALFIWEPNGAPVASKTIALKGNVDKPGVGPVQVSGFISQLLGDSTYAGPVTLSLAASSEPYTATIH